MSESIINPPPPRPDGLIWRPITRDDLTALVELAHTCFLVDGGLHFLFEPDEIISRFFPDEPGIAIGALNADGQLVACNSVTISGDSSTQRVTIVGHVRPDMRGRGVGTYLMRWSQAQAESLLADFPAVQRVLQIQTESLAEKASRLYEVHGFMQEMEQLVMRRYLDLPLPNRALPSEVTITNWQSDLTDQFFQAYDAAFRERPGFPGYKKVDEWVDSWTTDRFQSDWSMLAHAGDVSLGFLMATSNPPHGFVMQVGVVPSARRRGICSALMCEAMRRMQDAGAESAQLTVNVNNPGAIRTYVDLGFETIGRRARYERIVKQ